MTGVEMYERLFTDFLESADTLRVFDGDSLLFASGEMGVLSLIEYAERFSAHHRRVVIFDRVMGNAAALLAVKADCREVFSPLGSQLALATLKKYRIVYHITEIVPYIRGPGGEEMCPMEKLSIDKDPEEFYKAAREIIHVRRTGKGVDAGR